MKNIIKIIAIICLSFNCKSQTIVDLSTFNLGDNSNKYFKDLNNHFDKFTGTWENTTGNITFRVTLWKVLQIQFITINNCYADEINGSFKIIQNAGTPQEVVLHNSVKFYPINGSTSNSIIYLKTVNGIGAAGLITDNCTLPIGSQLGGRLRMEITNPGQSPSRARWTVRREGLGVVGGRVFTVPTDIILTKL